MVEHIQYHRYGESKKKKSGFLNVTSCLKSPGPSFGWDSCEILDKEWTSDDFLLPFNTWGLGLYVVCCVSTYTNEESMKNYRSPHERERFTNEWFHNPQIFTLVLTDFVPRWVPSSVILSIGSLQNAEIKDLILK